MEGGSQFDIVSLVRQTLRDWNVERRSNSVVLREVSIREREEREGAYSDAMDMETIDEVSN